MSFFGDGAGEKWKVDNTPQDLPEIDFMDNSFQKNPLEIFYWNLKELYGAFKDNPFYRRYARKFRLTHNAALGRDVMDKVRDWIDWVVKDNRNFIIYIFGEQGDGKSMFAIWLAVQIVAAWKRAGKESAFDWKFTEDELRQLISDPKFRNYFIAILDENPKLHGRLTKITEDALLNIIEQIRVTGKSIIVCSPTFKKEYPGLTVVFETAGKRPADLETRAFVHFLPASQQPKMLNTYVGSIIVDVKDMVPIYQKTYLPQKMKNVNKTQASRGTVSPVMDTDRIDPLIDELIEFAQNQGWTGSRIALMTAYEPSFAALKAKQENPINLAKDEELMLVQKAYDRNKAQTDSEKREKIKQVNVVVAQDKYDLAEEKILAELQADGSLGSNADQKLQAFAMRKDEWSLPDIGAKFGVSKQAVSEWIRTMNKQIAKRRGEKWESLDYQEMDDSGTFAELHRGLPGLSVADNWGVRKTDGVVEIHSDKCYFISSPGHKLPASEFQAEIDFARKKAAGGATVELWGVVLNLFNYKEKKFSINFAAPDPTYPIDVF